MKLSKSILSIAFLAMSAVTADMTAVDRANGLRVPDGHGDGDGDGTDFPPPVAAKTNPWIDPLCAEFVQSVKSEVEEVKAESEQDAAAFACSSVERESLMEFLKDLDALDYSTLADCQAEIYTEMFGDSSDIQDMIVILSNPETCLAEVHEEVEELHQARKLVASATSRELNHNEASVFGAIGSCFPDDTRCGEDCKFCCSNVFEWRPNPRWGNYCGYEPCWPKGTTCSDCDRVGNGCCAGKGECKWFWFGLCKCA